MARTEYENVFTGRNPDTGRPYFTRRKKRPTNSSQPPEEPPADPNLHTKEQLDELRKRQRDAAFEQHMAARPDLYPPED